MRLAHALAGIFLSLSVLSWPALGQDPVSTPANKAAAVAEQQGVDERFKQLAADLESLRAANQLLLDKLAALKEDVQQVRAEQSRLAAHAVSRDDLKSLAQRIEEVDKKRQDDKDIISEEIKKSSAHLETLLKPATEATPKPPLHAPPAVTTTSTTDGFTYTIKEGDRLPLIVNAYNDDFKNKGMKTITMTQAKEANPGVDWSRLKIGQKIVIPRPAD